MKSAGMMIREWSPDFFGQMIWLAILCAFGWLVTFVLTGKWFVFPILLVGLVVVAIHRAQEKQGGSRCSRLRLIGHAGRQTRRMPSLSGSTPSQRPRRRNSAWKPAR